MQKWQAWMVGYILGKLRGVRAKFWADLELVFNTAGLRVKLVKDRGLFSKTSRPKR